MATYGGQEIGAGEPERLGQGLKSCIIQGTAYSIMALVIYIFFSPQLSLPFLDASEVDLIADARLYLLVTGAFYIPLALVNIIRFMIQGMGFSGFAVFSDVFEMMARTTIGFEFVPVFGYAAACFASPAAWFWWMLF